MKTISIACMLLTTLFTAACTTTPKHTIAYTSHYTNSYQTAILEKCKHESDIMAFMLAEGKIARGEAIIREDVESLRKMLLDSCVRFYKIDV